MEVHKIQELREERAAKIAACRVLLDAAEAEKRDLTADETGEYESIETDIAGLNSRIKREETQRDRELEDAERADRFDPRLTQGDKPAEESEARAAAYTDAFVKYIRGVDEMTVEDRQILRSGEVRADQVVGTTTLGGFAVPTSFENKLVEHRVRAGQMRNTRVNIYESSTGEDHQIPKTTAHGTAFWVGENTAVTVSNETLGQVTLKSYVSAEIIRVSQQLLIDNAVNLEEYLGRALGGAIGRLQNTAYVVGTGTTQPTGITTLTSLGVTAASATAIATDELMDLFYSVIPEYRRDGEWMMNDQTVKAVRKLKLTTGEYIWAPGLQVGEPDTLLGKRVWDDPDMPAMTTGLKSIIFGDFSAYWIRDAGGFNIRRLEERYAENLLVGFLAWTRTDGNLVDQTGAVKHLIQA